jgi:hypothetical protein
MFLLIIDTHVSRCFYYYIGYSMEEITFAEICLKMWLMIMLVKNVVFNVLFMLLMTCFPMMSYFQMNC